MSAPYLYSAEKVYICTKRRMICDYLITPWKKVLHEKLTVAELHKKPLAFHRTQRFFNVFTRALHWP
jgi:hypothetical protein